ncbi:MAG: cytochrome c biogenesis protein ResB [Aurantimicrobium sp.]|nr:cytochrome c biogenesis protein ResB [Aurantimicrobium sp.]
MLRPSDHIDSAQANPGDDVRNVRLSLGGWLRWAWRQITSMRTALILLLLLAIAAVPGSIFPQRSSDPNGVAQYFADNPDTAAWLEGFQLFDVYTSVWFSAIYLLLFISLVGCVIPRAKHHWDALRGTPPATPQNLNRLPAHLTARMPGISADVAIAAAEGVLRRNRYRVRRYDAASRLTVSAERGYMRETGNLIFHVALVGVLIAVGLGGGFGYAGQRVVVEGQAFTNSLIAYDSFSPGRFFSDATLTPFSLRLDKFTTRYEETNVNAVGQPIDYTADVTIEQRGEAPVESVIKVNEPLNIGGSDVYLLGNGYAPEVTVRDPTGNIVYQEAVPFLPQDTNLTSVGVVKLPDGLSQQVGLIGFFYPTVNEGHAGASFSVYPDLLDPMLTFNVYAGDLGLNDGIPRSVYALDTSELTKLTGTKTDLPSLELRPGETAQLPNGLGSVSLETVKRFASLDVHRDPAQGWVLVFALAAVAGLLTSLFIPRRRVWISVREQAGGTVVEYGALARGDDPTLSGALTHIANAHGSNLGLERD